jgi:hypothetical protein
MSTLLQERPLGAWTGTPADDLRRALGVPSVSALPELGVIAVDGADAASFLQNQLTNDVARLTASDFQLNGYCTPKGRLLATFHQWRGDDRIFLQLPREILEPVRKRLSMYVLRLKARLTDVSPSFRTWGIVGPGAGDRLRDLGFDPPEASWKLSQVSGVRVARRPGSDAIAERYLVIAPADAGIGDPPRGFKPVSSGVWWWSEVRAAIPTVFAATQEKFVPQMINFEVLGGVDFKKGCYPGQEIVARSQYLGKLKRRMHRAHVADAGPFFAGADVVSEGAAVGSVIMAAAAPTGGCDLLFEAPLERLATELRIGGREGPVIEPGSLPYELFDPTA